MDAAEPSLRADCNAERSAEQPIYLDHHATTPVDDAVLAAMLPFFSEHYGNPASTDNAAGRRAAEAVQVARRQVAATIGAEPAEVIFTSGATEANNIAILGAIRALRERTGRKTIVTTPIEHPSVLEACRAAESDGFRVTQLSVELTGEVDLDQAGGAIDGDTLLVSVQAANNEIGTLQPIEQIAAIAHNAGAIFHVDAAQAVGKLPLDIGILNVDLMSVSGHKCYGPKGVGALFVRNGVRAFPIRALHFGGGHEYGLRPGTPNVPAIVGLGEAARLAAGRMDEHQAHLSHVRDVFEDKLLVDYPDVSINGARGNRLPNNSSVTFGGINAQALLARVPSLHLSTGSACSSGAPEPSYVLQAVGLGRREAAGTVRVGFGQGNSSRDASYAAATLADAALQLHGELPR